MFEEEQNSDVGATIEETHEANTDEEVQIPIEEEKPLKEPKNDVKEKMGKKALSFYNWDSKQVGAVIKKYGHWKTTFEGITIHNNGNVSSSARGDVLWATRDFPGVSWHYSVDDKEVVRFLAHPNHWNYSCWWQ